MKRFLRGKRGFTLVELMVVMAIMAVLAGIVVPTVIGVGSQAKGTAQTSDTKEVDDAVQKFSVDTSKFPTYGATPTNVANTPTNGWSAGSIPAANSTPAYAGINFTYSVAKSDGTPVALYPDYLKKLPKYAGTPATDLSQRWRIDSNHVVSIQLDGGTY